MLWNRTKSTSSTQPTHLRLIGVNINASRISAVSASGGTAKPIALAETTAEVPLVIHLETKQVGTVAFHTIRRTPHLVCSNFLSQLGIAREWRGSRITLTPESALFVTFETLRSAISSHGDRFVLTLPEYLAHGQVKSALDLAAKAKLSLAGSASSALAIAAHRAESLLVPKKEITEEKPDWVVPLRPLPAGPGVVVIVDVDEAALFASAVQVTESETKILNSAHWPRASLKLWKDRLIDAIADRCVRLCRRDPRDSAEAEQGLFHQLDDALDRSRRGQTVTLAARADRWYQDIAVSPTDLEAFTAALAKMAASEIGGMMSSLSLPTPPRSVWLSASAAKLPGVASALYEQCPEGTDVAVLPPEAAAEAAAALDARIRSGSLAAGHHDAVIASLPRASIKTIARATIS